jgi:glycosyltransferase involved in cell wall biosynthesis
MKKISIITPCLNEKENLIECCDRVKKIFNNELKTFDYEHIIVDNNSDSETYKIIKKLTQNDKKIKAIINNKNYGSGPSHDNGIKFATGDALISFLAADLQDPPELILQFIKKWELGYDLVVGIRKSRQEFFLMKVTRKLFYKIIKFVSGKKIFDGISDYQLIDKKILNEMKNIDSSFFFRTLAFDFTENYTFVEYEWKRRVRGKSHENISAYISTALKALMFTSSNPFRVFLYLGLLISFLSSLYLLNLIISYFSIGPQAQPGITLVIVIQLIFLSINFIVLGFIGEYLIYIFEVIGKNRKILIKEKINFSD